MPGSPAPFVAIQFLDNSAPAAGYKLFTYEAGTSTKLTTYSDYSLGTPNSNPIVLDSAGRCTVFLDQDVCKFVLATPTDTDPPTSPVWTRDNVVPAVGVTLRTAVNITAGQRLDAGDCCYISDGSGGQTAGRWYKTDSDQTYSANAAYVFGFATASIGTGETGTATINGQVSGLSGLAVGSTHFISSVSGRITATAPTNAVMIGKADSSISVVLPVVYGDATATIRGMMSVGAQTFSGVKTFSSQPQTYIGTATTLPATVAGVFFTDVTTYTVPASSTDMVMTDTTIPANLLNANGKALSIWLGGQGETGAGFQTIEVDFAGTEFIAISEIGSANGVVAEVMIYRIDSTTADYSVRTMNIGGRITGLDFTTALALRTLGSTAAATTVRQTYLSVEALN